MHALFCSLLLLLGTGSASTESPTEDGAMERRFEGHAQNAKGGAMLMTDSGAHYVRGMSSWPDGVRGQVVWMTGTVAHEKATSGRGPGTNAARGQSVARE